MNKIIRMQRLDIDGSLNSGGMLRADTGEVKACEKAAWRGAHVLGASEMSTPPKVRPRLGSLSKTHRCMCFAPKAYQCSPEMGNPPRSRP